MPFDPRDFWGISRTPVPTTDSVTSWRKKYYTKPKDAGMGANPFLRDRWNLSSRKLGIVAGANMNTEHETIEKEFPGNLKGLREAEDYCIQKLIDGKEKSYHILCMGLSRDQEYLGDRADNYMESIGIDGNGWW
jgi:hypothetical protein